MAKEPSLGADFFEKVERIYDQDTKVRWYYCVIVNLGAINYPELIPQAWDHAWQSMMVSLTPHGRFKVAQKFREALIKACGIMGPAKVCFHSDSED